VDAAPWGDDVRLSDLEPKFTCKACGRLGADVRPFFEKAGIGPTHEVSGRHTPANKTALAPSTVPEPPLPVRDFGRRKPEA